MNIEQPEIIVLTLSPVFHSIPLYRRKWNGMERKWNAVICQTYSRLPHMMKPSNAIMLSVVVNGYFTFTGSTYSYIMPVKD
jgi:hypothetical protein